MIGAGPEVVAHRGASEEKPEHTLAAYLRAIDQGADWLECDVRLTADHHLVCVHDRRVNRTSNGRGVVSTLELAQLETLDWGSWKGADRDGRDGERPDRDANRILTLRRLLAAVQDCGRPVGLAIETKHPTRYAGQVELKLTEVLEDFGLARGRAGEPPPVRVMSFSQLALGRMRLYAPEVPRVLLVEDRVPVRFKDGSLPHGVRAMGLDVRVLRRHPGHARRLAAQGNALHVWTVDSPEDVELCVEVGASAIITNRPAKVLAQLGRG